MLELDNSPIVITGKNGAGKTNLLEAISILYDAKGIRKAKADQLIKQSVNVENINTKNQPYSWAIFSELSGYQGDTTIGIALQNNDYSIDKKDKYIIKINGENSRKSHLSDYLSVCFLTPQMDQIFNLGRTSRRSYLDNITAIFFTDHNKHLNLYSATKSERSKLLSLRNQDEIWLKNIEKTIAEQAIIISAARIETVNILQKQIDLRQNSSFPKCKLAIKGDTESLLHQHSALASEEKLQIALKNARIQDTQSGRSSYGPHLSDFIVTHSGQNMAAEYCSTGQQKAMLLTITMALVEVKKQQSGHHPILLLDEVIAHLDEVKKEELFSEIKSLNTQIFLTGTEKKLFKNLGSDVQYIQL